MDTTIVKTKNGKDFNDLFEQVITCKLCKVNKTTMLGTGFCDACWILDKAINDNPDLAVTILLQRLNKNNKE